MVMEDRYFDTFSQEELWKRYCGFLDLSVDEFMQTQMELLTDEIERVAKSPLGKKTIGDRLPRNADEFRHLVRLTSHDDYEPYLGEQRKDVLAVEPCFWCHSSGRGGRFKWLPHSSESVERAARGMIAIFILASTTEKGRVNISPGLRFLSIVAPVPYASGCLFEALPRYFSVRIIPSPEEAAKLEMEERIRKAFLTALRDGVDIIGAIASVMVRMGESVAGQTRRTQFSLSMLHPKILNRWLRAWLRSKKEKRAILPKDFWPTKGIMAGGVDTSIYKSTIAHYWGTEPYEAYFSAETLCLAMQTWNRRGMVFLPDVAFLEFIPYEEHLKCMDNKDYQPATVLLNEVEEGKSYELVITQFYGLPLLRYRMKDLIKITGLKDDETGVNLPHFVFQRRVDDVISLAGLAQVDEKTVWQAISNTGIGYVGWAARKEYDRDQSFVRVYLELKEDKDAAEVAAMIDKQLQIVDTDYKDIDSYLSLQPVRVTLLSPGTFQRYTEEKRREGADLAHLKPSHINPSEATVQQLLQLSEVSK